MKCGRLFGGNNMAFLKMLLAGAVSLSALVDNLIAEETAQITLPNPSFEKEDAVRANEPDGWIANPAGGPLARDDSQSCSGQYSVRIDASEKPNTGWWTENRQAVEEGQTITFQGSVKLRNSWGDNELAILWYDANGKWLRTSRSEKQNGTCEWREVSVEAAVPPGARSVRFAVDRRFAAEGGMSWFDDLSVSVKGGHASAAAELPKDIPPDWNVELKPTGQGRDSLPGQAGDGENLLRNGKLQTGKGGLPEGWAPLENGWGKTEWSVAPAGQGRALSIADTLDPHAGWRSAPAAIPGGMEMTLALKLMMSHSSQVRMGLEWLDAERNSLGVTLSGRLDADETWQTNWMSAQPPAEARFVRVLVTQDKSSGVSRFTDFALTARPLAK